MGVGNLSRQSRSKDLVMQSKKKSFYEAVANVVVGYCFAIIAQIIIFPFFGMNPRLAENLIIGVIFTIVSLVRSYALRRIFNRI